MHRIVDAAQFDRIDRELGRQLVHRAFERIDVRHDRRRAHEAGRVAIGMHDADMRRDIGAGIDARRSIGAGDVIIRRPRRHLPALMQQSLELAVWSCAKLHPVAGFGAIGRDGEALRPCGHQPHRPVQALCRERNQRRPSGGAAARAKGAAGIARFHEDILGTHGELTGQRGS